MLPREQAAHAKHWILPISVERVKPTEKGNELGMQQLVNQIENLGIKNEVTHYMVLNLVVV